MKVQRTISGALSLDNLRRWLETIAQVLGGNVSYGETMGNTDDDLNLNIWKASGVTPGTANTNFTINHGLGRVPITIVGQDTTNGGLLYRGSVAWTTTTVTLRCTAVSSVYNVIIA